MNPDQRIQLVKSDRELVTEVIVSLIALGILYCAAHPGVMDDMRAWARRQADRWAHELSVWSARQSIRSLPETDES